MKIAVISDVHADSRKLALVLRRCEDAERIFNCGDLVGIGDVNRCMDMLRLAGALNVAGGHDLEALQEADDESGLTLLDPEGREVPPDFGLTPDNKEGLREWPLVRCHREGNDAYVFTHGFIRNPRHPEIMEVIDEHNLGEFLRRITAVSGCAPRAVFVGHSHVPKWFSVGPGGGIEDQGPMERGSTVHMLPGFIRVIDVGSITLPTWAALDTSAGIVTIHAI